MSPLDRAASNFFTSAFGMYWFIGESTVSEIGFDVSTSTGSGNTVGGNEGSATCCSVLIASLSIALFAGGFGLQRPGLTVGHLTHDKIFRVPVNLARETPVIRYRGKPVPLVR